jgi:hypothetical protein
VRVLTDDEREAVRMAGLLYSHIRDNVCGKGPTRAGDLAEIAASIHDIQYRVTGQAAARLYPRELRLMGEVAAPPENDPETDAEMVRLFHGDPPKPPAIQLLEEAPGDWDDKAETFLRSPLPPESEARGGD